MKKILILGANSYIGTSFHNYLTTKYHGQYQTDIVSLRGTDWKNRDWSGYDSVLNVTGKAHADISSLTEEQKKEYYAVNCDLAVEAARKAIADGVAQYIYFSSIIVYGDSSNSRKPVRIDSIAPGGACPARPRSGNRTANSVQCTVPGAMLP